MKINIIGTSGRSKDMQTYFNELSKDFKVNKYVRESFHSAQGTKQKETLSLKVIVENNFLDFMELYIIRKATGFLLKELLFDPLFRLLKNIDGMNDIKPADDIIFKYDDIEVKVAYARGNQQNAVSQISLKLLTLRNELENKGLGKLTSVVTPVKQIENIWKFYIPSQKFTLDQYLVYWGLEYNEMNKCVLHIPFKLIIHEHWW